MVSCPGPRLVKRQLAFFGADIPVTSLVAPSVLHGVTHVSPQHKGSRKIRGNLLGIVIVRGKRVRHPYFPYGDIVLRNVLFRRYEMSVRASVLERVVSTCVDMEESLRMISLPLQSWAVTILRTGGSVVRDCDMIF